MYINHANVCTGLWNAHLLLKQVCTVNDLWMCGFIISTLHFISIHGNTTVVKAHVYILTTQVRQSETGLKWSWIIVESERIEELQTIPECMHAWYNLWEYRVETDTDYSARNSNQNRVAEFCSRTQENGFTLCGTNASLSNVDLLPSAVYMQW